MGEDYGFTELEMDALREIMNMGFGQAAASLSEIINLYVVLSVPKIALISSQNTAGFIIQEQQDPAALSMVEQFFFGKFSGATVMVVPEEEGKKLLSLFDDSLDQSLLGDELDSLQRDSILEIGNIIIGACVGKIAEMLGDVVRYDPPRFSSGLPRDLSYGAVSGDGKRGLALVFKTVFQFERQAVTGYLFIVTSEESIRWIKAAIVDFLGKIA